MTLATLTDKERADLLRDICLVAGLSYDTTTVGDLLARLALIDDLAAARAESLWGGKQR